MISKNEDDVSSLDCENAIRISSQMLEVGTVRVLLDISQWQRREPIRTQVWTDPNTKAYKREFQWTRLIKQPNKRKSTKRLNKPLWTMNALRASAPRRCTTMKFFGQRLMSTVSHPLPKPPLPVRKWMRQLLASTNYLTGAKFWTANMDYSQFIEFDNFYGNANVGVLLTAQLPYGVLKWSIDVSYYSGDVLFCSVGRRDECQYYVEW